ncbi:ABA4-like family protein [Amycolatopsis magusensis]|uniref:ABA4-like family protein n=1 Tax=Amycolatopsis magusensis TaxID=882444 RepID=UPI0024A7BDD4|nr:ABA4-like family protein [Amycolatopsis magusensis]MDI5976461.1 ABA4-like family protein [Amycolatopsis magusensis]
MMSTLFDLTFVLVAPFWALMILAPRWSWTRRILSSPLVFAPPALLYLVIAVPRLAEVLPAVAQPSLTGLQELMAEPGAATLVWAHIIAFDLFVGRWMYLENREVGVHPLLMAPLLVLTILLAPIGALVWLVIRSVAGRSRAAREPVLAEPGRTAK